eukprot:gene32576-40201_t
MELSVEGALSVFFNREPVSRLATWTNPKHATTTTADKNTMPFSLLKILSYVDFVAGNPPSAVISGESDVQAAEKKKVVILPSAIAVVG